MKAMTENLNLTKILDGCPKGTRFYSTIYGEVEFDGIKDGPYPVILTVKQCLSLISVTPSGKHFADFGGECVLFPSKDQRDWSKFERFWDKPKVERFDPKTFQPFGVIDGNGDNR